MKKEKDMVLVGHFFLMVINMKENTEMAFHMDMERISLKMVIAI